MRKLFIFFLALLPVISEAGTFHAILIGDTEDGAIGISVQRDLSNIKKEVKEIAKLTEQKLDLHLLEGSDFNTERVFETLCELEVEPDDAILLYVSSHGFREKTKIQKWPNIHFPGFLDIVEGSLAYTSEQGLDQTEATAILLSKSPRLLISLVDVCNSVVDREVPRAENPYQKALFISWLFPDSEQKKENYTRLFLEERGAVISSSSGPGQYSLSTSRGGGFFTEQFLTALHQCTAKEEPASWDLIFEEARNKTVEKIQWYMENGYLEKDEQYMQTPQYEFLPAS